MVASETRKDCANEDHICWSPMLCKRIRRCYKSPRSIATIANALDAALVYFKDREDADHNGIDFVANEEMRLALEIEQAQAALEELRKMEADNARRATA